MFVHFTWPVMHHEGGGQDRGMEMRARWAFENRHQRTLIVVIASESCVPRYLSAARLLGICFLFIYSDDDIYNKKLKSRNECAEYQSMTGGAASQE